MGFPPSGSAAELQGVRRELDLTRSVADPKEYHGSGEARVIVMEMVFEQSRTEMRTQRQ